MKIRLGYVATALELKDCSPSKTVTLTNILKIADQETRINKIRRLARENLQNTLRILRYNAAHGIMLYRFSSRLIPLATHAIIQDWDYTGQLARELREIGTFIREHGLRVSFHPDQFIVLNSPDPAIVKSAIKDLQYHNQLLDSMGLGSAAKIVLHVGGVYKNKEAALERFTANFNDLESGIRQRIILENDDKSYNPLDVWQLCRQNDIPMVLDIHHNNCCGRVDLAAMLGDIFATWDSQPLPPKVHMSSPKGSSPGEFRMHAEYVDPGEFLDFLYLAGELKRDFDVMIEAKAKSLAMQKLLSDLGTIAGIKVREATVEV